MKYAIRIPANDNLERDIAELPTPRDLAGALLWWQTRCVRRSEKRTMHTPEVQIGNSGLFHLQRTLRNSFIRRALMFHPLSNTRNCLRKNIKTLASMCIPLILVGTAAALPFVERPGAARGSDPTPVQVKPMGLRHEGPRQLARKLDLTMSTSENWAGWVVTGPQGSVTDVKASWVVPSFTCPSGSDTYAAFWTGIDGAISKTVEQTGTESDCVGGQPSNYAWYEVYPEGFSYTIGNYTKSGVCESDCVSAGDIISAEVSVDPSGSGPKGHGPVNRGGPKFTLTIADETQHWTFTTSHAVGDAHQSSAEWITERLYGCTTANGYCLLSPFGTVDYSGAYATVGSSGSLPLGSFGNGIELTMEDPSGPAIAVPSGLDNTGTSFTVTEKNEGP